MLTVLLVCTGNICRSPAAALLLGDHLDDTVEVASAGTAGLVDAPVAPPMERLLAADGLDSGPFRSRRLTEPLVAGADLVLTLTAEHRRRVLALHPAALRRTFTLRELARLGRAVPVGVLPTGSDADRLHALVPAAVARRPHFAGMASDDDITDPFGQDDAAYTASYAAITAAVGDLVHAIRR